MKRNVKIANVLTALMLMTIILSSTATAGLIKEKKLNNLLSVKEGYVKLVIRGRIKDLEVNENSISFIPVDLVAVFKVNWYGFRLSEKIVLDNTNEIIELEDMDSFRGIYTNNYIIGYYYFDESTLLDF